MTKNAENIEELMKCLKNKNRKSSSTQTESVSNENKQTRSPAIGLNTRTSNGAIIEWHNLNSMIPPELVKTKELKTNESLEKQKHEFDLEKVRVFEI